VVADNAAEDADVALSSASADFECGSGWPFELPVEGRFSPLLFP